MRATLRDERGAAALLIAAGMVLFLGMAALAVDLGRGFNERRQDQSAADAGVMAGALSTVNGPAAMRDQALLFVESNLDTSYSGAEWQTLWEGCVDPAAQRNVGGFDFVAISPPAGWGVTDPANWCMSIDPAEGLFRVRVPFQIVETTFGKILGVDQLQTRAFAVAVINAGSGGVLPFGIPAGAGGDSQICLSSAPPGLAFDPCEGSVTGNFGVLKAPKFGSPIPTAENCTASPTEQVLAQNIAHGYDHIVVRAPGPAVATEVRDVCKNVGVNTLETSPGYPNLGLEWGLVGPVPVNPGGYSYTPRLAQAPMADLKNVMGFQVDERPLWEYLDFSATYGPSADGPDSCNPGGFYGGILQDWDKDGIPDLTNESWQHMDKCIDDYNAGPYAGVIFEKRIGENLARFGYVPQFWEPTLGGGSSWLHINRFRAVYLQSTMWMAGTDFVLASPGQDCIHVITGADVVPCTMPGNPDLIQLTSFLIPDDALPPSLSGANITQGGGVNPYQPELFR